MQNIKQIEAWVHALNKIDRSFFLVFEKGYTKDNNKFYGESHATITRHRKNDSRFDKYVFDFNFWPVRDHLSLKGDEIDIAMGIVEHAGMRAKIFSIFPYMNNDNTIEYMTDGLVRDITKMIDVRKEKQARTREKNNNENLDDMIESYLNPAINDKGQATPGDFYPDEVEEYMTSTQFISRSEVDLSAAFLGKNSIALSKYLNMPIRKDNSGDFPTNMYRTDVILAACTIKTKSEKAHEEFKLNAYLHKS